MRPVYPLFVLALAACTDGGSITETGNPELDVQITVLGVHDDGRRAALGGVDGAWTVLKDLRLDEGTICDVPDEGNDEDDVVGPVPLDLLAVEPASFVLEVTETTYCRLRVRLDRADGVPGGFPSDLDDSALVLTGTTGSGTPWRIVSRERLALDLQARTPFTLDEGRDALVVAFQVDRWVQGLGLDGLAPEPDGTILVDADHHDDVLDRFEDRADAMLTLHPDDDDDGFLNDDEAREVLAD